MMFFFLLSGLVCGTAFAQQKTIEGTVTDSKTGEGIRGVNIVVRGTTTGTATNGDGSYTLAVSSLSDTLVFSFVGYKSKVVPINDRTEIDVELAPKTIMAEELVVVGFDKKKKINLTGAVTQVSGEKLQTRPITNLAEGLQGLIPNLNVDLGGGEPGQGASFNIRGITSINGSGDPLILVDGVEMDPSLINPNNIKSVTVLKDAASAAIYGSRAAYGVILIKTKDPINEGLQVTYSGSVTMNRPANLPQNVNSLQYVTMHRLANRNGKKTGGAVAVRPFTKLDSIKTAQYFYHPKKYSPVYINPSNPMLYQYVGNTDWTDVWYPSWAPQMNHNLTVSGGNGRTSYLVSLGYFYQKGTAKPTNETFGRITPTIKLNTEVTSWFDLNFKAALHHTKLNKPTPNYISGPTSLITHDVRPTMPVRHPDGHFSGQGQYTNMVAVAKKNGRMLREVNDLWLSGGFTLNPISQLTIDGNLYWNLYRASRLKHWKTFKEYGPKGVIGLYPWTIPSAIERQTQRNTTTKIEIHAQYKNTFGKHHIEALVGYNRQLEKINGFIANANNLINQDLPTIDLNYDSKPAVGDSLSSWAMVGYFFRLSYRWDNKYILEINGRYDGSSRFPRGNRFLFTPSASVGWVISKEDFFEPVKDLINRLKVRVSYGKLGNQAISANFPYLATLPIGTTNYIFGSQTRPYVGAAGLVNTNFTWEEVYSKSAGLSFSMFENRLDVSFNYYIRDTKNMLVPGQPLPAVLGTSAPSKNAANLRTKGWGINMNLYQAVNEDWSFNISFNLSNSKSHITKYNLNSNKLLSNYYPGYQFGQIYGYVTEGFFKTNQQAQAADQSDLYGGQWKAGDINYKDLNGDGKITNGNNTVANPGDRRIIGNSRPHYKFGLNLTVNYKNFEFSTLLRGVGKRDFMPGSFSSYFWPFTSEWTVPTVGNLDYWTPQNRDAYFPALRFGGGGNFKPQTKYLQNAAYLRVKYITLAYTLPNSLLESTSIRNVRIYITGKNLFTITSLYDSFDPETLSAALYPLNKSYSFGFKIQF